MNPAPILPSDRQLVGAVRSGSDAAWNELMGRHETSVRSMLRSRKERKALAKRLANLRDTIENEDDTHEGDPAIRAFRPRALAALSGGTYGPTPHADGEHDQERSDPFDVTDDELIATAFALLPEPWQTVLWHSHVEQLTAAEISPLVGRTTNDVAELINTAERGLVDAFLIEYIGVGPLPPECERVVSLLGGYVRGTLPPHDQRLVERHLEGEASVAELSRSLAIPALADAATAEASPFAPPAARRHTPDDSRRLVEVIASLGSFVPSAIAPGVTGLSVEAQRQALGTTSRSFGSAGLLAARSDRFRRFATFGAIAGIVIALAGAAYLVRQPFDNDGTLITAGGDDTPASQVPVTTVADEPDPTVATTEPAPTTTEGLDLRPQPSGPSSAVELVVTDGIRAIGLRQAVPDLTLAVSSPAPIYAGGTGTIDVAVTNSGAAAADATVELLLPNGVSLEALAAGDAACTDPEGDSPFCTFSVEAGATLDFALRLRLESSTVGRLVVEGDLVTEPLEAAIVATSDLVHSSVGTGGVVTIGNSLMTCDDTAAAELGIDCADVRAGAGEFVNRWDVPMEFIGPAPQYGIVNSSSAVLDLPDASSIVSAHLYWSGDLEERQQSIPDDGSNELVTVLAPNGEVTQVVADRLSLGDIDATQYLGSADVTDIVAAGGTGSYLIGNVQSVEVQGSYAAWSLVVVYDNDAEPRRHRVVTRPFEWVAPQPRFEYAVDLPVPVVAGADAHLSVVAFEGERGFRPEAFTVGGEPLGGDAVFDSTISGERDPSYDNNLGVDIDAYDLVIDTADGTLPIRATSEKDGVRIAVLALSVDLAS
jgi:DNA-directed RNA polymerase specialized sigma24 family protein